MQSPPLPDPPPPASRPARPARRARPAARARIVAGVLSAVAFLGIGAADAASDRASTETTATTGGSETTTPGWSAVPGIIVPGQPPASSSHGS
jgi:hypothetical protein